MSDAINPAHYKRLPAEAIEIIEAMIAGAPDNKAAYLHGQGAKYDLRLWEKGKSLEDFLSDWQKHIWYALRLERHLIELVEKQTANEQRKAADLQSLKDHPSGELKTAPLNSDKIPEGYRKLNDSSVEPRQLGDLRWSVAEKRYVEITVDEIGYANRDNWAACRKAEPVVKQSLTTDPPDGWRWIDRGEVIREGDIPFENGEVYELEPIMLGMTLQPHWKPIIRRNRFEVGEEVIDCRTGAVSTVQHTDKQHPIVFVVGVTNGVESKHLAPYIEATGEVAEEATQEVNPPDGWRFLEEGEVIREADKPVYPGEVTVEVTQEVNPPDGWRWLEVGEALRHGDTTNTIVNEIPESWVGSKCVNEYFALRRNRFEVGEKVVVKDNTEIWEVDSIVNGVYLVKHNQVFFYTSFPEHLAPYIEETK